MHASRHAGMQAISHAGKQAGRQAGRHAGKHEAGGQASKQVGRQAGRQTGRQAHTDTHTRVHTGKGARADTITNMPYAQTPTCACRTSGAMPAWTPASSTCTVPTPTPCTARSGAHRVSRLVAFRWTAIAHQR
eukprot:5475978-Alexandrium_andersonii.AAC.1